MAAPMQRSRARAPVWRWVTRALLAAALAALLVFVWSRWDHEAMRAWMRSRPPAAFFAAMAVLPAVGVPITPFFIIAGATFGVRLALLGSLVALGTNLALCYAIAHGVRPAIESLLRRFEYDLPNFREREKGAIRFTLAVKLAPGVPAFVKNYGLGVAGVPFPVFFAVSMLITGVYAAALVVVGESMLEHQLDRAVIAAGALILLAVVVWWRSRRGRVLVSQRNG